MPKKSRRPYANIPDAELTPQQAMEVAQWYKADYEYARSELLRNAKYFRAKLGDQVLNGLDGIEIGPDGELRLTDDPPLLPDPADN